MQDLCKKYLDILNNNFKDFVFFEKDHHYEFKGQKVGISVTSLIETYTNEFNADAMAQMVATKENKTILEVLDDWQYKNDFSKAKGSTCHEFIQSLWTKEKWEPLLFDKSENYLSAVGLIQEQAINFKLDYDDKLEHLACEHIIGSDEYDIASAVDHLFVNKATGELVLVDYKTNTDIYKGDKYAKKMKVPLTHLKDTTLNHYAIQISIYKYLIEKYTGLKISEFFIVWFSEINEDYKIIEVPYLKEEVEKILENRRSKNMKSVPILLIGKSGAGKSASLRNFKKEEIAIANVLGKPLPFKSDLEAPKVDDYKIILEAIKKTDKKVIVIDDANYLITNEFMKNSSIKGYDKYNDMANNFWNLINGIKDIDGGKTVYLIMHEDVDEFGNVKPKTIGKLLDDKCNIQGLFTICIRAMYDGSNYIFRLKTNGQDCVKTPIGLFDEDQMENDLKVVDNKIREYYGLNGEAKNE